jgi:hypothetical protein
MNKKEICVAIPIYKEILNDFEIQSVEQCVKILSDYSICFVAPKGLNVDFYKAKFTAITPFVFFNESYFKDVSGYNRLLLDHKFYKKFSNFKFMLLYQTDCYVFKDELLEWANKDYDYIGGVWFEDYNGNPRLGAKLWQAGNGGLSLRKIKKFRKILGSTKPIKKWNILFKELQKLRNIGRLSYIKGIVYLPFYMFGYKNNRSYEAKNYKFNEDRFFIEMGIKNVGFVVPEVNQALLFSWDKHPAYLFEKMGELPFGCHAWYREDNPYQGNKDFWLQRIN